jgi:thiol:disulfide interchange protein
MKFVNRALFVLTIVSMTLGSAYAQQAPKDPQVLDSADVSNIYPADADAGKELKEALTRAVAEKKRVLLVFGANWCYDCHVLDRALHEGEPGKIIAERFLLIHVNIGEGEKNAELVKEYKIPLEKGVPAVAVLDSEGKLLFSSGQGEFEAARRMLKKDLLAFLQRWSPQGARG